ncbi:MAG: hypothetical protein II659_08175 [Bacteroidales bacterium]|nr:hypothetical protein [Bacteroidales bacterium]
MRKNEFSSKWIPVSSGNPTRKGKYLVTQEWEGGRRGVTYCYFSALGEWMVQTGKVVAWQIPFDILGIDPYNN